MDENRFWELIESCGGNACRVGLELQKTPPDDITEFNKIFYRLFSQAYHWDLWGAASLVLDGCGDDGFAFFSAWLIGSGKDAYYAAIANPEALADIVTSQDLEAYCENEDLMSVAAETYELVTGFQLDYDFDQPAEPGGEPWQEDELADRFPLLSQKFS